MTSVTTYSGAMSKYKFKVLGQDDSLLRTMSKLTKDDMAFSRYKSKRVTEQKAVNLTEGSPMKATALTRLKFVEDSFKIVKMSSRLDGNPKDINSALYQLTTELGKATEDYLMSDLQGTTAFDDDQFKERVQKMVDEITKMTNKQKRTLRGQGTIFNSTTNRILKTLNAALDDLDGLDIKRSLIEGKAAKAAAANSTDPSTPAPLDITV